MAEFGERIPGGIMKELFEYATGYDLVAIQLDIALGLIQPLENYCTKPVFESVIVKFLNCYPGGPLRAGAIKETHNLEQVRQMEGILAADFFVNADKPQEIRPLKRAADRCFFIVAGGKNREQAIERSEFAAKVIDFTDHEGKSLKS
jgi:biotin carboxylase